MNKHEQSWFIHFLCLCPLRLAIMLYFNISKVAYSHTLCREATLKTALELLDSRRADTTRAILARKQSPSESNSQRGRSCERIF